MKRAAVGSLIVFASVAPAAPGAPVEKAAGGAPAIAEQPIGRTVTAGGHVALSLTATGATPMTVQWWRNSEVFTNQGFTVADTNFVLNIDPALTNHSGTYFAVVTNDAGAVTSAPVSIVVSQLVFQLMAVGTGAVITVFGQVGDVYRVEVSENFAPFRTNGYATNFNGRATHLYRDPGGGGFRNFRVAFDHMLPVLYPPAREDANHIVRAYGKLNQAWQLQGTLNFQSWETASPPRTNTTGWVKFREFLPNNPARRFYRIVPP